MLIHLLCVAAGCLLLAGCTGTGGGGKAANELTGTLRSGFVAIGGEHTGWMLQAAEGATEVDVSAVAGQAQKLDGQRVTLRGRMTRKKYLERGETPVFVAEDIRAAP